MEKEIFAFISDARFFEVFSASHKPTEVKGRDFYSLTYRFKGKALIRCRGEVLESSADCITFMPKQLDYTTEIIEDVHMAVIHFDLPGGNVPDSPAVVRSNSPTVRALFQALLKKGVDESANFARMAILYNILAELQHLSHRESRGLIPQKIVMARELIEKGYSDPLFSIDRLACRIGISTSYLRREFLAAYGSAPVQYLKEIRIRNAKRLLLLGDSTVAKTAALCGYTGTSYFIQDFRKATGESPRRYQQRILLTL